MNRGARCAWLTLGTFVNATLGADRPTSADGASQIRIAHASGVIAVEAGVESAGDGGEPRAAYATVYRTARRLFEGRVLYRPGQLTR